MQKIAVTLGEPAGIGPDLGVMLTEKGYFNKNIVVLTDPDLLFASAKKLKKTISINILKNISSKTFSEKNLVNILPIKLNTKNIPGRMNPQNASLFSIGFSLFVVVIASLNLVLDFDFIEEASESNVPKYMEWYAAFGLLVTLIWLYLEILRLLAKLQSRRN